MLNVRDADGPPEEATVILTVAVVVAAAKGTNEETLAVAC
jgi:tellurite resistance protein